jgi:alkylresorcinol/alkylpyrone synthase
MPNHCVIAGTAIAVPEHAITREDARRWLRRVFPLDEVRYRTMLAVIDNSRIERRYFVHPVDYIVEPRPLVQVTEEYKEHSVRLGRQVTASCLAQSGISPRDIDLVITVSCTGFMIPSLDAYLINDFGFRSDVRRLPITELGCAAGASALSYAANFIGAFPEANVLVVTVELASLSFQRDNLSQANLISSALFGDGAAAAIVSAHARPGPRIINTESYFFHQALDAMGFDLKDTGFHIVLSRDVPYMIKSRVRSIVCEFLARNGLQPGDISAFVLHPGGQKLLAYVEEELGLTPEHTAFSWRMLRDYGNLSSASVLFILHDYLERRPFSAGDHGLMAAFGPGFSAELLLLQWSP